MPPTFPAPLVTLNMPLAGLPVACAVLKRDRAQIMALVDAGKIRWAFNVALELSTRSELRVLSLCLAECQNGKRIDWPTDEFGFVIKTIFPMVTAGVATLRAATVAKHLSVSIDHLFNLCAAKRIKLVKGTRRCSGPAGSPLVEFASVVEFLKQRRIV